MLYGNYCSIFIENLPQKFSPCTVLTVIFTIDTVKITVHTVKCTWAHFSYLNVTSNYSNAGFCVYGLGYGNPIEF